jgi:hypothetical protein
MTIIFVEEMPEAKKKNPELFLLQTLLLSFPLHENYHHLLFKTNVQNIQFNMTELYAYVRFA